MSDDNNTKSSSSCDTLEISLSSLSTNPFDESKTIKIQRTSKNSLEFITLKYLKAENENTKRYLSKLMESVEMKDREMKRLAREHAEWKQNYDQQVNFYEVIWNDSNFKIQQMREAIDEMKCRLRENGVEVPEIVFTSDDSDDEDISQNEE
jgi:site-specific recombinase